jgi:hypothetical protein
MNVRIQVNDEGEAFIALPEEMLSELGWKNNELIEVAPMVRYWQKGAEKQHVESIIHLRPVRM